MTIKDSLISVLDITISVIILFFLILNSISLFGIQVSYYDYLLKSIKVENNQSYLSFIEFVLIYIFSFLVIKRNILYIEVRAIIGNSIILICTIIAISVYPELVKIFTVIFFFGVLGNIIIYLFHKKSLKLYQRVCRLESILGVSDTGTKIDYYYTWFFSSYFFIFFVFNLLLGQS